MGPINPDARTTAARRAEIDDQAILERATSAVLIVDAASRIMALNPAAAQLLGSSRATLIGEPLEHHLVPTHPAADTAADPAADPAAPPATTSAAAARPLVPPAAPHGKLGLAYHVTDAGGHHHPVDVRLYPLPHPDGFRFAITLRPTGPETRPPRELLLEKRLPDVGLGIDITDHEHLEEALCLEKDLARRFLDIAGTINVVIGADGSILTLNRKGCELLGCDEAEAIGLNWFDSFLPERLREGVRGVFDRLMRGEIELVEYHENPICTPGGRERIIAWQNSVVTDKSGRIIGTLSSGLDITDRQQAEVALRVSETALRRSHEEISDLAGRLLHAQEEERRRIARDLHDGLNQSLALLSVELEQLGQKPPTSPAEISHQMQALCARVRELSSDVHRLSHQLHPAKLEYLGLVAAIRSFCDGLAAQVGLQVEFIHPEEQPTPSGDVALCLYRVVQESLRNVIKHSGARTVRVELDRIDAGLQLRISDTGVGFTPEGIREKGGLGLISMEERLRLVGGELSIDSRPTGGTCVEARVPLESGARERTARAPGSDR